MLYTQWVQPLKRHVFKQGTALAGCFCVASFIIFSRWTEEHGFSILCLCCLPWQTRSALSVALWSSRYSNSSLVEGVAVFMPSADLIFPFRIFPLRARHTGKVLLLHTIATALQNTHIHKDTFTFLSSHRQCITTTNSTLHTHANTYQF